MHAYQGSVGRWVELTTALLLGLGSTAQCPGQCQYEVTVIEGPQCAYGQASMYSCSLNEQGQVVGYFQCPTGYCEP